MNFAKCSRCGSNKDVVYSHTEDIEACCYECLKDYAKKYEGMEIIEEDGKELYYWKDNEVDEDFAEEIKVDNIVEFINEYYDKNSYKGNYVPSIEECHYCEVCGYELNRRDIMFVVYDEKCNEEYTICSECFAKLNGMKKVIFKDAESIYDKRYSLVYENDVVVEDYQEQQDKRVIQKIFDYCVNNLDIELVEEPMIQTKLTSFWSNTPKFYKPVNCTYNNIKSKM